MPSPTDQISALTAERSPWLRGPISVPGEPALSRLALILAGLSRGESVLENMTGGAEMAALAALLGRLGVRATERSGRWRVEGIGVGGFLTPDGILDFAGLGESAPLLIALLAAHDFETRIIGLAATPVTEVLLDFLRRNGVKVERPAVHEAILRGPRFAIPLDLALPLEALALKAPLLLQALVTTGTSTLHLPAGGLDPAESLLSAFGAKLGIEESEAGVRVDVAGMAPLRAQAMVMSGDPVLAAYPAVAALLSPDSEVIVSSVSLTPGRLAILDALQMLGGDLSLEAPADGGANTTDLRVSHSKLTGTTIPASLDIASEDRTILAIAAAFAEGETMIEGMDAGHHRLALTRALRDNGIDCEEREGGLLVRGQARVPGGGKLAARLDPKLAMSFLVLGMVADQPVTIDDGGVMAELFPDFVAGFEHIGASFSQ